MSTKQNIEFKAYCSDIAEIKGKCRAVGARETKTYIQTDTYFHVSRGRLKLRMNNNHDHCLIHYNRLNSANIRESTFRMIEVTPYSSEIFDLLREALGISVEVRKHRDVFETDVALINLDIIENLGSFIEIEVMMSKAGTSREALNIAKELKDAFGITQADIIPYSYSDLVLMRESSRYWREKLNSSTSHGTLYLIDGVSCSGKTSITHAILADKALDLCFIPRFTTRKRRKEETTESEYIFVSQKEFNELISSGAFIEYRDFEFGMSYGMTWEKAITPLLDGRNAFGIINLGNVHHVKNMFPEAITILIDAPIDTIRRRLIARRYHTEEQIEERIQNAKSISYYKSYYDHVINNDDGFLEHSIASVREVILKKDRVTK